MTVESDIVLVQSDQATHTIGSKVWSESDKETQWRTENGLRLRPHMEGESWLNVSDLHRQVQALQETVNRLETRADSHKGQAY